jgi:glyoxylase-like metal-dependent hydrolase (beta-lactamase superfamily II)
MKVTALNLGPLETNCFVCSEAGKAVVVDPGGEPSAVLKLLRAEKLELAQILVTHLHCDHIYGCKALAEATGAPVLASATDDFLMQTEVGRGGLFGLPLVDEFAYADLKPGRHEFLGLECRVLATPGHTPGSLTFYFPAQGHAFVGDLLFYRSVGRTDFPGGSSETLSASVRNEIFTLPGETVVHPGHGPDTSVGDEKHHNPFFAGFQP